MGANPRDPRSLPKLDWYLNIQGRKTGPFSLDDIKELLKSGEIPETVPATTSVLQGQWMPLQAILESSIASPSSPRPTPQFRPPERPNFSAPPAKGPPPTPMPKANTAVDNLFETLQIAREKKLQASQGENTAGLHITELAPRPFYTKRPFQFGVLATLSAFLVIQLLTPPADPTFSTPSPAKSTANRPAPLQNDSKDPVTPSDNLPPAPVSVSADTLGGAKRSPSSVSPLKALINQPLKKPEITTALPAQGKSPDEEANRDNDRRDDDRRDDGDRDRDAERDREHEQNDTRDAEPRDRRDVISDEPPRD